MAKAYTELTPEQRIRSGLVGPSHGTQLKIEVTDEGELTVDDLVLKPIVANVDDLE